MAPPFLSHRVIWLIPGTGRDWGREREREREGEAKIPWIPLDTEPSVCCSQFKLIDSTSDLGKAWWVCMEAKERGMHGEMHGADNEALARVPPSRRKSPQIAWKITGWQSAALNWRPQKVIVLATGSAVSSSLLKMSHEHPRIGNLSVCLPLSLSLCPCQS